MSIKLSEWKLRMSGNVESKLAKISGSSDRAASKFSRLQNKIATGGRELKSQLTQLPGMGPAIAAVASPIGLAVAGVALVGATLTKASKASTEFSNTFLELKNLNLDKTNDQVAVLRDNVLGVSFDKGFDPQKTSQAFFDVQSATGKYGDEVTSVVEKVGEFARINKADFNESVAGASKAMGIFNIGAKEMDGYLASSFKTVQVGVTTFDQLAKVQVEYAGAAAAAGQKFDEANKLFAVFSGTAKSVDIAANLTKTAFQGLTASSTVDGLKEIGVEVFDADGKMRKLTDIVEDLVPKFKKMSAEEFTKVRDGIGGPEGLKNLFDNLKSSGDKVLSTFTAFDETEFNLGKAIKNASEDTALLGEQIDSKLNVAWIKMGDAVNPLWLKMKQGFSGMLDSMATQVGLLGDAWNMAFNQDKLQADTKSKGEKAFTDQFGHRGAEIAEEKGSKKLQSLQKLDDAMNQLDAQMKASKGNLMLESSTLGKMQALNKIIEVATGKDSTPGGASPLRDLANDKVNDVATTTTKQKSSERVNRGLVAIAAGGKSVKNINVHIEKMVGVENMHPATLREGISNMSDQLKEGMMRGVRGAEIAMND